MNEVEEFIGLLVADLEHFLAEVDEASHLQQFAYKWLKKQGLFDKDGDYGGMLGKAVMRQIDVFSKEGHSGFSAALARIAFNQIFKDYEKEGREWAKREVAKYRKDRQEHPEKYATGPVLVSEGPGEFWVDLEELDDVDWRYAILPPEREQTPASLLLQEKRAGSKRLPKGGKWVTAKSGPARGKPLLLVGKKIVAPKGAAAVQGMQGLPSDGMSYLPGDSAMEAAIDDVIKETVGESKDLDMEAVYNKVEASEWGQKNQYSSDGEHLSKDLSKTGHLIVSSWYMNTNMPSSQNMQNAVRQVFGIKNDISNAGDREGKFTGRPALGEVVLAARVIYKATQAHLKARGITEVSAYRGTNKPPGAAANQVLGGGNVNLSLRALNSFSSSVSVARGFARYGNMTAGVPLKKGTAILIESKVPAKQVFMTADSMPRRQRPAFYNEGEVSVLGTMRMTATTKSAKVKGKRRVGRKTVPNIVWEEVREAVEPKAWMWVDLEEMDDGKDWRQEYRRGSKQKRVVTEAEQKLLRGGRWGIAESGPMRGCLIYITE